jgi:hypothetical protein
VRLTELWSGFECTNYISLVKLTHMCQDGRVGLRRQFQVLVRKGMGSNPILDNSFSFFSPFGADERGKLVTLPVIL